MCIHNETKAKKIHLCLLSTPSHRRHLFRYIWHGPYSLILEGQDFDFIFYVYIWMCICINIYTQSLGLPGDRKI